MARKHVKGKTDGPVCRGVPDQNDIEMKSAKRSERSTF
jgi:hypothetical protein